MTAKKVIPILVGVVVAALSLFLSVDRPALPDWNARADFAAALDAQARVTAEWIDHDGVVGTAVGLGPSGQPVVKVYLTAAGVATLPLSVAGVSVIPEITGRIQALPASDEDGARRGFERPVPIGVSAGHPSVTAGTIGARVTDGTDVFALSNNHVAAANNDGNEGDNLLQPGVADGGRDPDDALGTLADYEPIGFCRSLMCPSNRIDAAIVRTTTDNLGTATPDGGYGSPRVHTDEAKLGMTVQKFGRTTGHTVGRVTGINATIDVNYRTGTARFVDQIVISDGTFSGPGDSGSLVVTKGLLLGDRRPVALLFAGSNVNTIANPIDLVLDRFGVTVDGEGR